MESTAAPTSSDGARTARLAADIGGTFTDVVLEVQQGSELPERFTTKVLTTPQAPADAVIDGVEQVLATSGVDASEVELVVHGTTLATNALIERRGAVTALLTTEGFRDSVAMAHENRFEQYDLAMERPEPLVPRHLRLGVPERLAADGEVLVPLDEDAVRALVPTLIEQGVTSVAVGFLHSFVDAEPRADGSARSSADELPEVAGHPLVGGVPRDSRIRAASQPPAPMLIFSPSWPPTWPTWPSRSGEARGQRPLSS